MIKTLDGKEIINFDQLKVSQRLKKICDSCGSESTPQWRHIKESRDKWNKDLCKICSKTKNNQLPKIRYGRKLKHGKEGDYIMLWDENRKRYIAEHQLVVEDTTGFAMVGTKWRIHHIDGIKNNNDFNNLYPTRNDKEHKKLHAQLQEMAFELVRRNILFFDRFKGAYFINPIIENSTMPQSLGFEDVAIIQQKSICNSRLDVKIKSEIIRNIYLDIPLIASNMSTVTNSDFCIQLEKLGSMGVLHRAAPNNILEEETQKIAKENKLVAVSIGIGHSQFDLSKKLIKLGANIIFIDVAHGYCDPVIDLGKKIKQFSPSTHIVVGNTVNAGLFSECSEFASAVKIGIAQGLACETKNTAGVTDKQFSAIQKCLLASKTYGLPIISDGGIREPADFTKAIGAGSSSVMAGSIFARCPESNAETIETQDGIKKIYAGMASRYVQEKWRNGLKKGTCPEGKTIYLPIGESVKNLIERYSGALRSSITYAGFNNIEDFCGNAKFTRISR